MNKYLLGCLFLLVAFSSYSQKLGYINDPDGFTNIRSENNSQSPILGMITNGQEFKYTSDASAIWWKVEFHFVKGYIHKSRIISRDSVKSHVKVTLKYFCDSTQKGIESMNQHSKSLLKLTHNFPLVLIEVFNELEIGEKLHLANLFLNQDNDLQDLQLAHARLYTADSKSKTSLLLQKSLVTCASFKGKKLEKITLFNSNIPKENQKDSNDNALLFNNLYVTQINGKPITFYLNHPQIDVWAKMYYQGQFKISDDSITFQIMDSVLCSNKTIRPFYLHIYISMMSGFDGALSEYASSVCEAFVLKYPCEFVQLRDNLLYSHIYEKWIDLAAFELLYHDSPNEIINSSIEDMKLKVNVQCSQELDELEYIKVKWMQYVMENEE